MAGMLSCASTYSPRLPVETSTRPVRCAYTVAYYVLPLRRLCRMASSHHHPPLPPPPPTSPPPPPVYVCVPLPQFHNVLFCASHTAVPSSRYYVTGAPFCEPATCRFQCTPCGPRIMLMWKFISAVVLSAYQCTCWWTLPPPSMTRMLIW